MIKLINVSKYYKTEAGVSVGLVKANLEFNVGEFVAVVGESGSGKTTLLNVISGLDTYEDGEMYIFDEPTSHFEIEDLEKYRSTYVGFVFQNYNIIDSYTVLQNITVALELQGYPRNQIKSRALELIKRVGLTHRKNHKAAKLSGGEKQRVVIARALAKDCPIIVADEPTGNLDSKSGAEVMALLNEISKDKLVIIVSHNYEEVKPYATRKVRIHDGQIVEDVILKQVETTSKIEKPEVKEFTLQQTFRWSLLDLFSKPRRFLFLLISQLVVMFLFSISYAGTQMAVEAMNDTGVYRWNNNFYTENRINIQRFDGNEITLDEIEAFKKDERVISVSTNSMQFLDGGGNLSLAATTYFGRREILGTSHNTIFKQGKGELQSGKIPTEVNEVILSNDFRNEFKLNDELKLTMPHEFSEFFPEVKVIVKGFSNDNNSIIYFDERFATPGNLGFELFVARVGSSLNLYLNGEARKIYYFYEDDVNNSFDFYVTPEFLEDLQTIEIKDYNQTYYLSNVAEADVKTLTNIMNFNVGYSKLYKIAEEVYNSRYEISLIVKDRTDANAVINKIDNSVYQIRTHSQVEDTYFTLIKKIFGIVAFVGSIINLLFLYAILGLVIRNSMNARKKDFAIFRSIGTNEKTIGILVISQQIIVSVLSYIILLITVGILRIVVPASFLDFRILHWYHFLILFVLFILFSVWLGFRFNKKIFKITVIKNLQIEEVI